MLALQKYTQHSYSVLVYHLCIEIGYMICAQKDVGLCAFVFKHNGTPPREMFELSFS